MECLDFNNSTLILSAPGAILFLREQIFNIISSEVIGSKKNRINRIVAFSF